MDLLYIIILLLFFVGYSLGYFSIITEKHNKFFSQFPFGFYSLSKSDSQPLLNKIKKIVTCVYIYNTLILVLLGLLAPHIDPIFIALLALSVPILRKSLEKIIEDRFGLDKKSSHKYSNKK